MGGGILDYAEEDLMVDTTPFQVRLFNSTCSLSNCSIVSLMLR